jgi:hypothetical protein
MLTALRLQNFKSFKDQRVEFGPVTLLVGANASGKSNLLDALRFLKGAALGMPLEDVLEDPQRSRQRERMWPGIRGGAKEVGFRGSTRFTLTSEWMIEGGRFEYSIECDVSATPRVVREQLTRDDEPLLGGERSHDRPDDIYDVHFGLMGHRAGNVGMYTDPWRAGIAARLDDLAPVEFSRPLAEWRRYEALLAAFRETLHGLTLHEIQPSLMRGYVPIRESDLGVHAENLSAVLYHAFKDPEIKRSLLDWLRELCGEEIADVDFSETDLDDVMMVVKDVHGARTSARSLSDGTLRFLGLLTALREPGPRSRRILLLEEPEIGLHPSRLYLLAEQLASRAAQGRQVIATTHAPGLLGALSESALGDTVVCSIDPEGDGTIARRVRDLPDFAEVLARRGIEYLYTTRWLERAL